MRRNEPNSVRYALGALLSLGALNAFGGGAFGLSGARGIPTEWLEGSPFADYVVPSLILVVAVVPFAWASAAAQRLRPATAQAGLAIGIVLGIGFLVFQYVIVQESLDRFRPTTDAYGSIFYTLTGLHYVHVAAGVLLGLWALARTWRFDRTAVLTVRVTALYWYFLALGAVLGGAALIFLRERTDIWMLLAGTVAVGVGLAPLLF